MTFVVNFTTGRPRFGGQTHSNSVAGPLVSKLQTRTRMTLCQPCGPCRRSHSHALLDRGEFLPTETDGGTATPTQAEAERFGTAIRVVPWPHAAPTPTPVVLGSGPSTARDWSLKPVVLAAASETVKGGSSCSAPLAGPWRKMGLHGCRLVRTCRGRPCFLPLIVCGLLVSAMPTEAVVAGLAWRRGPRCAPGTGRGSKAVAAAHSQPLGRTTARIHSYPERVARLGYRRVWTVWVVLCLTACFRVKGRDRCSCPASDFHRFLYRSTNWQIWNNFVKLGNHQSRSELPIISDT